MEKPERPLITEDGLRTDGRGPRDLRPVKIEVGVAYGTDLDRVKSLLVKICKKHPEVLDDPPPKAYFINFGDSSLDMMLVCRVGEWGQQWRVGEELRMDIKKTFEKEGIEIPFPQRVITINKSR